MASVLTPCLFTLTVAYAGSGPCVERAPPVTVRWKSAAQAGMSEGTLHRVRVPTWQLPKWTEHAGN